MSAPGRARVLFVGPMLGQTGGIPQALEPLFPLLQARGIDVRVTSRNPSRWARAAEIARECAVAQDTDIGCVQIYGGRSFVVEAIATQLLALRKKRVVMVLHGGALPEFFARHEDWSRHVLSQAHRIVVPSSYLAETTDRLGFSATIVPNPVDLDAVAFRLRATCAPKVLWLRAFHEIYRPELAVATVHALRERGIDVRLTMVGPDRGARNEVESLIKRLGLQAHVELLGQAGPSEKRALFEQHDVFLTTSSVDNFPVSVLEAGAAGLPVVAARVGGLPAMLEGSADVVEGNARALSEAIANLVNDAGRATHRSQAGRVMAEQSALDVIADRWQSIFQAL